MNQFKISEKSVAFADIMLNYYSSFSTARRNISDILLSLKIIRDCYA